MDERFDVQLARDDGQSLTFGNFGQTYAILHTPTGIAAADAYEFDEVKNAMLDGVSITTKRIARRTITIPVECLVGDRQRLLRFLNPKIGGVAYIFYNEHERRIAYYPLAPQVDATPTRDWCVITVNLLCPSPFLLTRSPRVINMATILPVFSFPFLGLIPIGGQVISFRETSSDKLIVNDGDCDAPVNLTFTATRGNVVNPSTTH